MLYEINNQNKQAFFDLINNTSHSDEKTSQNTYNLTLYITKTFKTGVLLFATQATEYLAFYQNALSVENVSCNIDIISNFWVSKETYDKLNTVLNGVDFDILSIIGGI